MLHQLLRISTSLSSEKDLTKILENIITASMEITNADAGTLYRVTDHQKLKFEIVHTKSKNVHLGGNSGKPIILQDIPLYSASGSPNLIYTTCYAYHNNQTINIPDAYNNQEFDFSGTRNFDIHNQYKSISFLNVPMKDHHAEIIGILQLINASDPITKKIIPFSTEHQEIIEALCSQAAITITNRTLLSQYEELFESFISLINHAIDDKSPHTGGHCQRVPTLTLMIADAVNNQKEGPFANFSLPEGNRQELKLASMLHDCGKITTPVHVVDKSTKLETIFDRIELIELKAEIIMRDIQLGFANNFIENTNASNRQEQLIQDFNFLCNCNIGVESMKDADIKLVHDIATRYIWQDSSGINHYFLDENEVTNLTIKSGTLNKDERQIINRHIDVSIGMLERLKWPKHLLNVTEYAAGHHERMDGKGYPRGLHRDEMSVPARCMAIADIFEALTAKDRPYKKGKMLSESLIILGKMKLNQHIDPDLFDIFMWNKLYEQYARQYMDKDQIDSIDVNLIPGYQAPP